MRIFLPLLLLALFLAVSCGEEKRPVTDTDGIAEADNDGIDTDDDTGEADLPETDGLPEKDGLPEIDSLPEKDDDGTDADPEGDDPTEGSDATDSGDTGPDVDQIWADADDDGDGIPNGVECAADPCQDTDGDMIPDNLDLDSDDDGIPDSVEAPSGLPLDDDKDGTPNFKDTDSDGDTVPDAIEAGADPTKPVDTDIDGTVDYRDIDSDGDNILDSVEVGVDPELPVDSDEDGTPDLLDTDSDDDGIGDLYEHQIDPDLDDFDGDGVPNYLDDDSDGDGIDDGDEKGTGTAPADTDEDGLSNFIDGDSDGDGLSDAKEHEIGSNPTLTDTDGDDVDDNTEFVLGLDPNDPLSTIPEGFFYLELPYEDPAKLRDLEFSTDIRTADIAILVDLSNSMSGEHTNLKTSINDIIIDQVSAAISDSNFGLVKFGPIDMNQTDSTAKAANVYLPAQTMTDNATLVQTAVGAIAVTPGTYEYITEALYQTASGAGTYQRICHATNGCGVAQGGYEILVDIDPAVCPDSHLGGACFRPGALPIVIMMTDEAFTTDFGNWLSVDKFGNPIADDTPRTVTEVVEAMNDINAKFIGLDSSAGQVAMPFYEEIATGTGSVDGLGADFNQQINSDGSGMSQNIVDAVIQLTQHIEIEVSTMRKHIDNLFGVNDTTQFILSVTPESFVDVQPGQKVTFEVTFRNTIYNNTSTESRLFIAQIEVWGAGTILDTRDCYIIVPGKDPSKPDS